MSFCPFLLAFYVMFPYISFIQFVSLARAQWLSSLEVFLLHLVTSEQGDSRDPMSPDILNMFTASKFEFL